MPGGFGLLSSTLLQIPDTCAWLNSPLAPRNYVYQMDTLVRSPLTCKNGAASFAQAFPGDYAAYKMTALYIFDSYRPANWEIISVEVFCDDPPAASGSQVKRIRTQATTSTTDAAMAVQATLQNLVATGYQSFVWQVNAMLPGGRRRKVLSTPTLGQASMIKYKAGEATCVREQPSTFTTAECGADFFDVTVVQVCVFIWGPAVGHTGRAVYIHSLAHL